MRYHLVFLLSIGGLGSIYAQAPLTGQQAYEHLQNERGKARQLWSKDTLTKAERYEQADRILGEALIYYDRPDVQALAMKNMYLSARKADILRDRAIVQAKWGNRAKAIDYIRQTIDLSGSGSWVLSYLEEDSTFRELTQDAAYQTQKNRSAAVSRVFSANALKTPYRKNISDAEKLAGLAEFWSEAKYNFAYFDHIPNVDWDKLYLEYIPKVQATSTTLAYLRVMQQFAAQLQDGHTNVWTTSDTLSNLISARPPIRTALVEDRVLITDVLSDSLQQTGIQPGQEIVSIDGIPVMTYARQQIEPYQSGSTVQDRTVRTYNYALLRGPKDQPITLELKDANGKMSRRTLPRTGYGKLRSTESFAYQLLPGNVAYVALNEFETNQTRKRFAALFDTLSSSQALVIDMRRNGGGNTDLTVLSYLTDKPISMGQQLVRRYIPTYRARGEGVIWQQEPEGLWAANGKKLYSKPVVLLIGPQTFSAAEDFVAAFETMKRGTLIGEATGGSTGQPLPFPLPGGLMARVCTKRDAYPDGTEWNGKGIQPTIVVKPTVADYQAGRDTVLETALAYLQPKESGKAPKKKRNK